MSGFVAAALLLVVLGTATQPAGARIVGMGPGGTVFCVMQTSG